MTYVIATTTLARTPPDVRVRAAYREALRLAASAARALASGDESSARAPLVLLTRLGVRMAPWLHARPGSAPAEAAGCPLWAALAALVPLLGRPDLIETHHRVACATLLDACRALPARGE